MAQHTNKSFTFLNKKRKMFAILTSINLPSINLLQLILIHTKPQLRALLRCASHRQIINLSHKLVV